MFIISSQSMIKSLGMKNKEKDMKNTREQGCSNCPVHKQPLYACPNDCASKTEQEPSREREKQEAKLTATFFRHGKPDYSREELVSGQLEGQLSENAQRDVEKAAEQFALEIDPDKELVVMWSSPKNRAIQTSQIVRRVLKEKGIPFLRRKSGDVRQTKVLEMIRDFETGGDMQGSPFWDKLLEVQEEDIFLPSGKKMGIANWQESLHELSKTEGFEALNAENPEHIKKRVMSILAHLESVARRIQPPEGKTLRFVVFGHEEIVTPILQEAIGQGVESGTGPTYAEQLSVSIHPSTEEKEAVMDITFRDKKTALAFNPRTRTIHSLEE